MPWESDEFLDIEDDIFGLLSEEEDEENTGSKSRYDEEDEEKEEEYASFEDNGEYQQRFEYSKNKKQKEKYPGIKDNREMESSCKTERKQEDLQSPEERGHKWGCGCPGCQRFMRTFPELDPSLINSVKDGKSPERKNYVEKDRSSYPCGGRLRNEYHKMLKFTMGSDKGYEYSLGIKKRDVMKSLAF